jgi:hypothetical protein
MTREELRVFLQGWFCGCGNPDDAAKTLHDVLAAHVARDRDTLTALLPDVGVRHLLLYTLDHFGLTEHGSSVEGAWLTDKGTRVFEALVREAPDNFETLTEGDVCIHGYSFDVGCVECDALNAPAGAAR